MDQRTVFVVFGGLIVFAAFANVYGALTRAKRKVHGKKTKLNGYDKSPIIKDKTTSYHLLVGLWMIFSITAIILTVYGCKVIFIMGNTGVISTTIALVISGIITLAGLGLHIRKKRMLTIYAKPLGYHDNIWVHTELSVFLTGWQTSVAVAAVSAVVILTGNIPVAAGVFIIYGLWLGITVGGSRMSLKRIEKLFKNDNAEALVRYYKKISHQKSGRNIKPSLTIKAAMAYGFYGQIQKAEEELSKYDWKNAPKNCRFYEKSGKAILNYLKNVYHVDGFIYAQQSMEELRHAILEYDESFFGNIKNKDRQLEEMLMVQNSLLQIGELLTHNYDPQIIDSLEQKYKVLCKTHINHSLIIAGCLSKIYGEIGIRDKKQKMLDYCSQMAPFCESILNIQ